MYLIFGTALLLLGIGIGLTWPWLDRQVQQRIEARLSLLLKGEARISTWGLSLGELYVTGLHLNAADGRQLQVNELRLRAWLSTWLRGGVLNIEASHWTLSALTQWRESLKQESEAPLALDLSLRCGAFDLGYARADWFLVDSARIRLDAGFSSLGPAILRSPTGDRLTLPGDESFVLDLKGHSLSGALPESLRALIASSARDSDSGNIASLSGAFDFKEQRLLLPKLEGQGLLAGLELKAELKSREDYSLQLCWRPSEELRSQLISGLDLSLKTLDAFEPILSLSPTLKLALAANEPLAASLEAEGLSARFQAAQRNQLWPLTGLLEATIQADCLEAVVARSGQEVLRLDPGASPLDLRIVLASEALQIEALWPQLPFLWSAPDGQGGVTRAHYQLSELELQLRGAWGSTLLSLERGRARLFDGEVSLSELAVDLAELSYLGRLNYENLRLDDWPVSESETLGLYFGGRGSGHIEFSGRDFDPIGFRALGELRVKTPVFAFLDLIQGFLTSFGLPPLHRESPHEAHAKLVMADGGFMLREIHASLISVALRGHWGFDKDFQTDSHVHVTIQPTLFQRRALSGLFSALMREPLVLEFTGTGPIDAPRFTPHYGRGVGEVLRRFLGA